MSAKTKSGIAESVTRAYINALNAGDADAAASCVTNDFVNEHTSTTGESVTGRYNYRQRLIGFFAKFRFLNYDIEDLIVDGERIAMPYRMSARWVDTDGDEHPFEIRGIFRFMIRDEKIACRVDYWDSAEFDRQIGMNQP